MAKHYNISSMRNYQTTVFVGLLLLIFPLLFTGISNSCDKNLNYHDGSGLVGCWGCNAYVSIITANTNLGSFFPGQVVHLPSSGGENYVLEFKLTGNSRALYNVSFNFNPECSLPPGYARITKWTIEKADYSTNGNYGQADYNKTDPYSSVQLYQPEGASHCEAWARFRISAKEIYISPNAGPGRISFDINVNAEIK